MAQSLKFFQRNHVPLGKRADGYSTQGGDMPPAAKGAAEIAGQRPHIRPLAALRLEAGMVRIRHVDQRQAVDVHDPGFELRLLAVAGDVISALAFNLDCGKPRRHLFDSTDEPWQKRLDCVRRWTRVARLHDPSLGVVSIPFFAPANDKTITFTPVLHEQHRFAGVHQSYRPSSSHERVYSALLP